MRQRSAGRLGQALAVGQLAGGAALLARPESAARLSAGRRGQRPPTPIVRVLGARLAAQGAGALLRPTRTVVLGGAAVDALHAASMVGLAATSVRYRRPALVSAIAAIAAAGCACVTIPGRALP